LISILFFFNASRAWAAPDEPLEKVTLQLKWRHHFQFAGYYAAIEKGFYRDAGLEVALVEGKPGVDFIDEVVSGRADYGVEMPGLLIERDKGKPVVVLAPIFQHSPLILIMRKDSGLETPQDLRGKTVMVRFTSDAELLAVFINEGIPLEEVQLSELSWDTDDLIDGKVDAIHAYLTNEPFLLQEKDVPYTVIRPLTYGIDFYGDCLFTSEKEIEERPERAKAFREASLRGWGYAMKHPEEMIDLILAEYDPQYSREAMLYEAKAIRELMLPHLVEVGHMNPGRWRHIGDTFVSLGMLEPDYSLDGFLYDPSPEADYTWARWVFGLLGAVVALISAWVAILLIFNRRLRGAVEIRTQELSKANEELSYEVVDRSRAEEALVESEERYREFIEGTEDLVTRVDGAGRFVYVNQAVERAYGLKAEECIGLSVFEFVHPDDREETERIFAQYMRERASVGAFENRQVSRSGEVRHMSWKSTFQFSASGEVVGINSIARDITERKRSEKELGRYRESLEELVKERTTELESRVSEVEQLNLAMVNLSDDLQVTNADLEAKSRQLTDANKELEAFAYSVSHDLRAPLRHISGFADILIDNSADSLDPAGLRHLETIVQAARRMSRLIDDLLAFSRTGRAELNKRKLDIGKLVEESVQDLQQTMEGRDIVWEIEELPEVFADRSTLRIALVNLLDNAIKYTGTRKQARIEVGTATSDNADEITFFVRDNGVGFDMKYAHKLFGVFQRLHSADEFEGTGIGLANIRRIIHRHGGKTWAEGVPDEGATFYFSLPVYTEE
jgi:PAS domain S-box-containing protein